MRKREHKRERERENGEKRPRRGSSFWEEEGPDVGSLELHLLWTQL